MRKNKTGREIKKFRRTFPMAAQRQRMLENSLSFVLRGKEKFLSGR
jgi:hypothetical protein